MIKPIMVIVLLISLVRVGAAQSVDQAKLRQAIQLPEMSANFQFTFNQDKDDPKARIAALQKTLQGNPSDAEVYVKIGDIYKAQPLNDPDQAKVVYLQASTLFRKQLEMQPQNAWIMAQLGTALFDVSQHTEAEKLLREAVRIAPNDWRTWANLGDFIQNHAFLQFGDGKPFDLSFTNSSAVQMVKRFLNNKTPADQIALLQNAATEAHADFDRAVSLNPNAAEPYQRRSNFFLLDQTVTKNLIRIAKQESPDYSSISSEAMDDAWKVAGLLPDDPDAQGEAVFFEMMRFVPTGRIFSQPGAVKQLPAASQERVHAVMDRLHKTAEGKDRHKAINAAVDLAGISYLNGDPAQMEQMAKRALDLDPKCPSAWQVLFTAYAFADKYKEFADAMESRIKSEDTPYNRLALAKAYEQLSNSKLACDQVLAALQKFPEDLLINLAAVDVLMLRTDADALKQAGDRMAHTQALFAQMSDEDRKANQTNLELTRGVYLALIGRGEFAKQALQRVLSVDADNEQAKRVMALLGGSP